MINAFKPRFSVAEQMVPKPSERTEVRPRGLKRQTPCAVKGDKCYDCNSPERICNGLSIHYRKLSSCETEVVIVGEPLGY